MANYNAIRYNVPYSDGGAGCLRLIKTLTASSSSTLSFVDGSSDVVLDSTYKEYLFILNNIHPSDNAVAFQFNGSADTGSNYNATKTTSFHQGYTEEDGGSTAWSYDTGSDLAQSTSFQNFTSGSSANNNDDCLAATVKLFNPSSTTFVKHFMIEAQAINSTSDPNVTINKIAGYFNTTSAIDAIQFKCASGTIDSGTIQLFGVL